MSTRLIRSITGAACLLSCTAALAQTPQQTRPRNLPPGSYLLPLAPRTVWNPAQELVEQEFMYMRANGPNPDRFLYGRYNPRYQVVTPPQFVVNGPGYGGGYGPIYGGYPGYGFNGGYQYGFGGPNVIQREVIIVRDPTREPQDQEIRRPAQPPQDPGQGAQPDGFYLSPGQTRSPAGASEALPDALTDIRKAWLNGDFDRIKAHFQEAGTVGIFPKGRFQTRMESAQFLAVIKDAMERLDTVSFELDRPRMLSESRAFVTGRHVLVDEQKTRRESFVSYVLEKTNGRWNVIEAGSSSTGAIARHETP